MATDIWGIVSSLDTFTQMQSQLKSQVVQLVHYSSLPTKIQHLDCMFVESALWRPNFSEYPVVLLIQTTDELDGLQEPPREYVVISQMNATVLHWAVQSARERQFFLQQAIQLQFSLRNVEERFHSTVQVSSDSIILVNANGVVEFANKAAHALFESNNLVGESLGLPLTSTNNITGLSILTRQKHARFVEMRVDETTWYGSLAFVIILRDVTEQRQMRQSLSESEERFRISMQNAPFPIMLYEDTGDVIFINKVWSDITGYTQEATMTIESWIEHVHQGDVKSFLDVSKTEGVTQQGVFTIQTAHGTVRYWEFQSVRLTPADASDKQLILSMAVDLTERLENQERIRLFQRAVEASPMGITITDHIAEDNPLIYVNSAFEQITGYSSEDVIGHNCRFLQQDDRDQASISVIRQAIADRTECKVMLRNYRKNGEFFWNEFSMAPVYDELGQVTHFVGVQQDVTEAKENEQAILRSNEQFRKLRAISDELANAREVETVYGVLYHEIGEEILRAANMAISSYHVLDDTLSCDMFIPDWHAREGLQREQLELSKIGLTKQLIPDLLKGIQIFNDLREYEWYLFGYEVESAIHIHLMTFEGKHTILSFWSNRPNYFRDANLSFAMMIVRQSGIALASARIYRQMAEQANELRALYNATSILFQSRNLLALGQQIVRTVVHEFYHPDCAFLSVNQKNGNISRVALAGKQRRLGHDILRTDDDLGLIAEAVRTGEVVYVPDAHKHPQYLNGLNSTKSELVIPLRASTGIVGVLDFQSSEEDYFTQQDIRILRAFAERAANAIETVQLYEELDKYASQLEWNVARRTSELHQAKEQIEYIFNGIKDVILLLDVNGAIERANPAYQDWFAESSIGRKRLADIVTVDSRPNVDKFLERVLQTGVPSRFDGQIRPKDDDSSLIDVEIMLAVIKGHESTRKQIVCTLHDITTRKQLELSLRESLDREHELVELKTRFTSMVSHEFRTPLAVIVSSASMLIDYYERYDEERAKIKLSGIVEQVQRLTRVMDDVLLLSRSDAVGMICEPKTVDLHVLCEKIVEEIRQAGSAERQVRVEIPDTVTTVSLDDDLIRHILHNLISNAIKYSPDDTVVKLNVTQDDRYITFEIIDQGIGIPEKEQKRVFTTFFRAANVGSINGTGLGLVIAARATEAHHGHISFTSKADVGTTFIVKIPV